MGLKTEYGIVENLDVNTVIKNTSGDVNINSDPRGANIIRSNRLEANRSELVRGIIMEVCSSLYAYKVALERARGVVLCCALQTGGANSNMIFDSSCYSEGTSVLVSIAPRHNSGIILGAIPFEADGSNVVIRDRISNASQNTPDVSDNACMSLATEDNPYVGLKNFAMGEPLDVTSVGSNGHITATGAKTHLNPFMITSSVNDYTGMWQFVEDSLLRLSGLNLQIRSSGSEWEFLNDNGEFLEYQGTAIYPWEQIGKITPPSGSEETIKQTPQEEYRNEGTWKSYVEPAEDKAKPFHRVAQYGGWLGQGRFRQVVAPDKSKIWSLFEDKEKLQGLTRLAESLDGWISSISANGTFIGKRGLIPSVARVNRPDETSTEIGDNPDNYDKTNKFEAKPEIPVSDPPLPMERIMGLQDYIAYQQNFKDLVPFLQHKNDYYVPEDSELNEGLTRFARFSELSGKQFTSVPEGNDVNIVYGGDIPDRKVKLNPSEAGVACLPDGSVVIYGGCGEEIRMSGGSIFLDAPGGIWLKSGRETVLWGGKDVEIRAKENMDISTTNGSVRIKAEEKLSMLGGNGGKDGVLIESKGTSNTYDFTEGGDKDTFGGILLKSEKGVVGALGATIYLRSGVMDGGDGIFLDANNGEHSIYTMCNSYENYVEDSFNIHFSNLKMGTVDAVDKFTKENVYLNGNTTVTDNIWVGSSIYVGYDMYASGHVFTGKAKDYSLYVGDYSRGERQLKKNIESITDKITETLPQDSAENYNNTITSNLASEKHIANEATIVNSSFTFRTTEEYNLPDEFAVYEARWQNITDNAGQTVGKWEEKPVKDAQYDETYPFPGKEAFTEPGKYITQAWTLTDYSTGLYKDRWSVDDAALDYKDPVYGEQKKKSLNEYPVIG